VIAHFRFSENVSDARHPIRRITGWEGWLAPAAVASGTQKRAGASHPSQPVILHGLGALLKISNRHRESPVGDGTSEEL
jgi:hypothetical protein